MANKDSSELAAAKRFEGCLCKVGSPNGSDATIEHVYLGRRNQFGQVRAKVIMLDSGSVRHLNFFDIYPR